MPHLGVLDLLLTVEVDRVVVGHKLIPFEELDRCLVQLNHDDLVQQRQALDILLRAGD